MAGRTHHHLKSITDFHRFRNYPPPQHPMVSVVNYEEIDLTRIDEPSSLMLDFYSIALKRVEGGKMRYGQQEYDFDEGVMLFIAPGQVFAIENKGNAIQSGWGLLIHPDFLWNKPLAKKITKYQYFSYAVNEALHLSDKEEATITGIMQNIKQEYSANMDKFSRDVIIAQIELLLTYCERFYQRQFLTRNIISHQLLDRTEALLSQFFEDDTVSEKGLPTVQFIAEQLNVTPNYLSSLLKVLTGRSTQQHIHDKLIEKAKERLSTTNLSVSEIAFSLGFEHPQSFSKLFKTKTNYSPLEFRNSFN